MMQNVTEKRSMINYILCDAITVNEILDKLAKWTIQATNAAIASALESNGFDDAYLSEHSEEFKIISMPLDDEKLFMLNKCMLVHGNDKLLYLEVFLDERLKNVVVRTQIFEKNDDIGKEKDEEVHSK